MQEILDLGYWSSGIFFERQLDTPNQLDLLQENRLAAPAAGGQRPTINISINSKKMFDRDGDADAVTQIDQEMARLAAKGNTTPQALAHSMLRVLLDQGRFIPAADQESQMMMLT